jgi:hypothetical protein
MVKGKECGRGKVGGFLPIGLLIPFVFRFAPLVTNKDSESEKTLIYIDLNLKNSRHFLATQETRG